MELEAYQKAISDGNNTSYKFALGFSILELYLDKPEIEYLEIAKKLAYYYFRNVYMFNIREETNVSKKSQTWQIIKSFTDKLESEGTKIPAKLSEQYKHSIAENFLKTGVLKYVLPCFEGAEKSGSSYSYNQEGENSFFEYSKQKQRLVLKHEFCELIKSHRELLKDITVFEWAKFCEKYNTIPNLILKLSPEDRKRSMEKFRGFLVQYHKDLPEQERICFICEKSLDYNEISLDHVIPFNYIYSDDLWNLVPVHQRCNSSKGNKIGSEKEFEFLHKRNKIFFEKYSHNETVKKYLLKSFDKFEAVHSKINDLKESCKKAGYTQN